MAEVKLASPWVLYERKLEALLGEDPDIHIDFDEDENEIFVKVDNPTKAAALDELLPAVVDFGNVELFITVVPANPSYTVADLYRIAFTGNPAFDFVETAEGDNVFSANYCVFKNKVVQYRADDLSSYYGVQSTLYEDIADEIFEGNHDGVYFCTGLSE